MLNYAAIYWEINKKIVGGKLEKQKTTHGEYVSLVGDNIKGNKLSEPPI
jgi:hypothetical protein